MSKKLSLVVLVLGAVVVALGNVPRDVSVAGAMLVSVLFVWAYARSFVAWIAAGTHYGT